MLLQQFHRQRLFRSGKWALLLAVCLLPGCGGSGSAPANLPQTTPPALSAPAEKQPLAPVQLVVGIDPASDDDTIPARLLHWGQEIGQLPQIHVRLLALNAGITLDAAIAALTLMPWVRYAEANSDLPTAGLPVPNDYWPQVAVANFNEENNLTSCCRTYPQGNWSPGI